jgi:glycosyltransferase involved in cell wall biosynthesis
VVVPSTSEICPPALVAALESQTLPPHEIIHIYDGELIGAAWSRNRGIERASGDIVAFIDDDCVPPAQWLASISEAMTQYDADIVGGTYDECDSFLRARRSRQQYPSVTGPDSKGQVGAGGNIAIRKEMLQRAEAMYGYIFDESFRISQDWELIWRLRSLDANVVFLATPVRHQKSLGARSYLQQQFFRGIGIARLDRVRRQLKPGLVTHQSLLWSHPDEAKWKRICKLVWYKGFGPFDRRSFDSTRQFLLFWLGEKIQSLGYLWSKWRSPDQAVSGTIS